jgi:hypothetical protein
VPLIRRSVVSIGETEDSLTRSKSVSGGCEHGLMTGDDLDKNSLARDGLKQARREAATAQARLAEVAVRYADIRIAEEQAAAAGSTVTGPNRPRPGEFVADEVAVMLREHPYQVRCLLARSRRLAAGLPTV